MSLLVSIIKASDSVTITESSKTFDTQGGTLGRGADNTWVLEDPERYLSSCHCRISYENGRYFITDLSTNGTFYNGSTNPIGKGASLEMHDGDTFIVGDYEFSVSVSDSDKPSDSLDGLYADPFAQAGPSSPFPAQDDFAQDLGSSEDPFASGHVSASDSLFAESSAETDPLAALDRAQGRPDASPEFSHDSNPFDSASTFSDQADPLNQQITWPEAVAEQAVPGVGAIPDDWDADLSLTPSAAPLKPSIPLTTPPVIPRPAQGSFPEGRQANHVEQPAEQKNAAPFVSPHESAPAGLLQEQQDAIEKANAKIHAELEMLKQQISAQQTGLRSDVAVDTTLINALGFQKHSLTEAQISEINQLAGEVIKEMVRGLMQVLGSRGSIKNEFRMHVTTIQPVENNPIKFSANVDDALENMFLKQGNAFKKPVEAVQEGFESVAEHQVAVLAGIKAAFKGIVERFDPALLEERFSKQSKGGFIPGIHKAKYWDLYHDYFNELADDLDKSFQYLFGDDFVRAYEEQLQKIAIAKKAKKATTAK